MIGRHALRLEFHKMRRLRTAPITAAMVVAVAALSVAFGLYAGGAQQTLDDPSAHPWEGLLLSYTTMAAMTSPILAAVLASRQTDIEHTGSGWILAATAGRPSGALCRAKLAVLAIVLLPAVAVQTLLVLVAGVLVGIIVPLDMSPWLGYSLLLFLVDAAFCALHIWLAASVENQLVSVGVGMLGAFLAVFSLLIPADVGRLIPWGYYAVISHASQIGGDAAYVVPPYGWVAGFLILVGVVFAVATRRLDRAER